ncbi:MAG: OmpA family protein [Hyphomicrobiales bacterium]|nr:OmpA family protein [Hyphomicrobiales bacterium]
MNRPPGQSAFEMDRLRELLLQPEADRLAGLEGKVDALGAYVGAPDRLEAATAGVLVEAFRRAEIDRHQELANAVAPVVVAAIKHEIVNSKDMMIEALYPITGRLVAAAVAAAFRDLVADLNQRLDSTFSARRWKYRLQSIRTGRPVSELALADAQSPDLRRLLLLERGGGRPLALWQKDQTQSDEERAELTSGLIAALSDFASTVYGEQSELRALDLGGSRVYLRAAPIYIVAAECSGVVKPEHEHELDTRFLALVSTLDRTPRDAQPAIETMAGELFRPKAPAKRKKPKALIAIAAALGAAALFFAGSWALRAYRTQAIKTAFETARAARPQLQGWPVHVSVDAAAGKAIVTGLVPAQSESDALAAAVRAAAPYVVEQATTTLDDSSQAARLDKAAERAALAARTQGDVNAQLAARQDTLAAELAAARQSIATLQQRLADPHAELDALLRHSAIFFTRDDTIADEAAANARLDRIAAAVKKDGGALRVVGHADLSGIEASNAALARKRAETVAAMLVARGVPQSRITTVGRSTAEPIATSAQPSDVRNRRVTFEPLFDGEVQP